MRRKYIRKGPPDGRFAPRLTQEGAKVFNLKEADDAQKDDQRVNERRERSALVRSNMWRVPLTRFFAIYEGNPSVDGGIVLSIGHRRFMLMRNMRKASEAHSRSTVNDPDRVWDRIRKWHAQQTV